MMMKLPILPCVENLELVLSLSYETPCIFKNDTRVVQIYCP